MKHILSLSLAFLSLFMLTACGGSMTREFDQNARYWQRIDTTDAIYQRGPKAQQMLFENMATCTSTVIELKRLGAVKNSIPPSTWDSTARDGYLKSDHKDYTDFETCMTSMGWERVKHVDYETVNRARNDYVDSINREKSRTDSGEIVKRTYKLNE